MSLPIFAAADWGRATRGNPPRLFLGDIKEMTVHYTGTARFNRTPERIAASIKSVERFQMGRDANMSAVAYNFFVDRWGRIWEGRGWQYRNAANGTTSNRHSFSVCVLVGVEDNEPTPEIVAALQQLYAEGCRRTGTRLAVRGHQEHKATSCPGPALMALIRSGRIRQEPTTAPAPTPSPAPAAPSATTYVVQRGDSYWRIASKVLGSGARWREISDLNGGKALHAGLVLSVPGGTAPAPVVAPAPQPAFTTYTVVRGDSYWRISRKLYGTGTRWREISDLNGGKSLYPGTALKVRAT